MNPKRLLAILLALFMLLALFSACSNTEAEPEDGTVENDSEDVNTPSDSEDDAQGGDELPESSDPTELTFLSFEAHGSYTLDSCMECSCAIK